MNFEAAREQMIEQQVRAWDVFNDDVLNAMREVRREDFVTKGLHNVAFADSSIPLPHGQTMLSPSVHGRILQALAVTPNEIVLEIGAGSGYLSACLGRLGSRVRSLEIIPELAELARANLLNAAANNVAVEVGDGTKLDEPGLYDVIAVTGSLPVYDERFQLALKPGGRLFVIVGQAPAMEAWLVTRMGEREWQRQSLFETVVDPLINAAQPPAFVF
jgi:protein-L-isoaspartate(D-aspartate) O-methyltransferase